MLMSRLNKGCCGIDLLKSGRGGVTRTVWNESVGRTYGPDGLS